MASPSSIHVTVSRIWPTNVRQLFLKCIDQSSAKLFSNSLTFYSVVCTTVITLQFVNNFVTIYETLKRYFWPPKLQRVLILITERRQLQNINYELF